MAWLLAAALSALFAGLTSILAKCGIRKTDSDVATALRTVIVLLFSWIMVFIVGSAGTITSIDSKSLLFLVLSGIATGASWICYFKALSVGNVNKVVPIDKSSTVLTILLAIILFGETNHLWVKLAGTALLAAGVFLMIEKKSDNAKETRSAWLPYAAGSAVFAALTSILAKIGIAGVESNGKNCAYSLRNSRKRRCQQGERRRGARGNFASRKLAGAAGGRGEGGQRCL